MEKYFEVGKYNLLEGKAENIKASRKEKVGGSLFPREVNFEC